MLEHTLHALGGRKRPSICDIGDSALRARLRGLFFPENRVPTGEDLAQLDYIEATILALDDLTTFLPGERRPREEDRFALGNVLGRATARAFLKGPDHDLGERLAEILEEAVEKSAGITDLGPREKAGLFASVVAETVAFMNDVCGGCSVRCFEQPKKVIRSTFYGPEHPSLRDDGPTETGLCFAEKDGGR